MEEPIKVVPVKDVQALMTLVAGAYANGQLSEVTFGLVAKQFESWRTNIGNYGWENNINLELAPRYPPEPIPEPAPVPLPEERTDFDRSPIDVEVSAAPMPETEMLQPD